jgi:hypothetical protein
MVFQGAPLTATPRSLDARDMGDSCADSLDGDTGDAWRLHTRYSVRRSGHVVVYARDCWCSPVLDKVADHHPKRAATPTPRNKTLDAAELCSGLPEVASPIGSVVQQSMGWDRRTSSRSG